MKPSVTKPTTSARSAHAAEPSPERAQALSKLLLGTASLPTLAEVPLRVLALLDAEDVSLGAIATELDRDPVLAARLLRLANSPLFSRGARLDGIRQAVVRLGFGELRTAVATIGFVDSLGVRSPVFDMQEIFREAVCCASMSRRLAQSGRSAETSSAYLAGLLHSMGQIVLGLCFTERFEDCVLRSRRSLVAISEVIEREFGFGAPAIGAHLLERWRMPDAVIDAVRFQEFPERSPHPDSLAGLVATAYRTARSLGIGIEWPGDSACDWEALAIQALERDRPQTDPRQYLESCRESLSELEESIRVLVPEAPRGSTPLLS